LGYSFGVFEKSGGKSKGLPSLLVQGVRPLSANAAYLGKLAPDSDVLSKFLPNRRSFLFAFHSGSAFLGELTRSFL